MPKEAKSKEKKTKQTKQKNQFFKDVKAELKKVIWPTPKQLLNNTLAVVTIVIIIGLIVFVLDLCFEKLNQYGINKLKEAVQTTNTLSENEESNSEETTTETTNSEDVEVENAEQSNDQVQSNVENIENQTANNVENAE